MKRLRLYLASASPRRRDLLRQIGVDPVLMPVCVDERPAAEETPRVVVRRLAEAKARLAARDLDPSAHGVLLAADTAVVIDGVCLGKPADRDDAAAMLRRLRGREHAVLTGVFVMSVDGRRAVGGVDTTRVRFRRYDDATIAAYVASGEGDDKAGAYGIQGRGVLLVDQIEGSWSNVVGLPLERLLGWMAGVGIDLWDLIDGPHTPA
jgi:septum formation protein